MRSLIYGIGEATPVDDDHVPRMARFTRYLERQDDACPGLHSDPRTARQPPGVRGTQCCAVCALGGCIESLTFATGWAPPSATSISLAHVAWNCDYTESPGPWRRRGHRMRAVEQYLADKVALVGEDALAIARMY